MWGLCSPPPAPGEFSRAQSTGSAPLGTGGKSVEQPNSNKVFQLNVHILHARPHVRDHMCDFVDFSGQPHSAKSCYYYLQLKEQRSSIFNKVTQLLSSRVGT